MRGSSSVTWKSHQAGMNCLVPAFWGVPDHSWVALR